MSYISFNIGKVFHPELEFYKTINSVQCHLYLTSNRKLVYDNKHNTVFPARMTRIDNCFPCSFPTIYISHAALPHYISLFIFNLLKQSVCGDNHTMLCAI